MDGVGFEDGRDTRGSPSGIVRSFGRPKMGVGGKRRTESVRGVNGFPPELFLPRSTGVYELQLDRMR